MFDESFAGSDHALRSLEGLQRRVAAALRHRVGIEGFRGSYGRMLDMIPPEGTRPSFLAEGAWITKQAVGVRLQDLIERGWVETRRDPRDGRALIVRRTQEGDRVLQTALAAITAMEAEWAELVGPDRYAIFRAVLDELAHEYLLPPAES